MYALLHNLSDYEWPTVPNIQLAAYRPRYISDCVAYHSVAVAEHRLTTLNYTTEYRQSQPLVWPNWGRTAAPVAPLAASNTVDLIKDVEAGTDVPKRKFQFPGHQISWLIEWVSGWVSDFSPWASSATEVATETKFGTKVA